MLNAEKKRELIANGKAKEYRKKRSEMIVFDALDLCERAKNDEEIASILFDLPSEDVKECERIRNNSLRQRNKIETHLNFLMDGNWHLLFLTLTFSDECLAGTSFKTRKTRIVRLLSSIFDDYIVNVDYGKENEREHYHAIVSSIEKPVKDKDGHMRIKSLDDRYRYGFYEIEEIRRHEKDKMKLSRYVTKLTMHSIKVRQNYVSVKKGSPYQEFKKIRREMDKQKYEGSRIFTPDYDEKITYLLSGYYTSTDA